MRRDYYLHKRKNGIYYVEFIDKANGKKLSARSTGESELLKAQVRAELWLVNGIPTGRRKKPRPIEEAAGIESIIRLIGKTELNADDALRIVEKLKNIGLINIAAVKNTGAGAVQFVEYLKIFWDYDKSEYIKTRLGLGKHIGRNHAYQCMTRVNSVLADFFGDKKLNCVTITDLRKLTNLLYERGLSTSTANQIMLCVETPLRWAFKHGVIPSDPCMGLDKFNIENKERGIPTDTELREILQPEHWKDFRAFVATVVSITTGAREGEILALRPSSITDNDLLSINNSYSRIDGIKCPKNTKKRPVTLYPYVKKYLMDLLSQSPYNGIDDPFFFFSLSPDKPCDCKILLNGLKDAMDSVNKKYMEAAKKEKLDKPEIHIDYNARNIVFHSLRHWYITKANLESDAKKVMKVSGHLSESIFQRYAAHIDENDIREVGKTMGKVFDSILPENVLRFRKVG